MISDMSLCPLIKNGFILYGSREPLVGDEDSRVVAHIGLYADMYELLEQGLAARLRLQSKLHQPRCVFFWNWLLT